MGSFLGLARRCSSACGPIYCLLPSIYRYGVGEQALLSPTSTPTTARALHVYRKKGSALHSFIDSHRIVPTHAVIGALVMLCIYSSLFSRHRQKRYRSSSRADHSSFDKSTPVALSQMGAVRAPCMCASCGSGGGNRQDSLDSGAGWPGFGPPIGCCMSMLFGVGWPCGGVIAAIKEKNKGECPPGHPHQSQ